jgi:ABC-type polysaccharide/polyol phosphate export permease
VAATLPALRAWRHRTPAGTFSESAPRRPGLVGTLVRIGLELVEHRHALGVFVASQFRATYRAQALGLFWPIANPLLLTIVLSVVLGAVFPSGMDGYPVFLLLGLVVWNFMTHAWTGGTRALVTHTAIVKNTELPPHLVIVGSVGSSAVALGLASLSLLPLLAVYPDSFRLSPALFALPVVLALLFLLAIALSLATSVLHVLYRDVAYVVDSILLVFFWLTPILYPLERVPARLRRILLVNPLAAILSALRDILMGGRLPPAHVFLSGVATTLVLALVGAHLYRRHAPFVSDHV